MTYQITNDSTDKIEELMRINCSVQQPQPHAQQKVYYFATGATPGGGQPQQYNIKLKIRTNKTLI